MTLVLDASAAIEIALWTDIGQRLAEHVAEAGEVVVPDHFYLECAAALRRLELRKTVTPEESLAALVKVLELQVRRVDTMPLMRDAWRRRQNITVPDALYVVVAERLDVPLVTGDVRLTKAPNLGVEVLTHLSQTVPPRPHEASTPTVTARDRVEVLTRVFLHSGWSRWLPEGAVVILGVLIERPLDRSELHAELSAATAGLGLESEAWDPVHEWTDEELAGQRAEFADTPLAATDESPSTAAEVMAEEAELRGQRLAEVDRAAAVFGLGPVRRLGELVELMVACRVLLIDPAGRYDLNAAAPLPAEVLPLSPEAAAREDQLRWSDLHEGTAQAVIRLFKPASAEPRSQLRTSLRELAAQLEVDVESVRAGLTNLLNDGDFSVDYDVSAAGEDQIFKFSVDWARFDRTRLDFVHGSSSDAAADDE